MKIECKNCQSILDVPDDRLERLGPKISFPCPKCKGTIDINLEAVTDVPEHAAGSYLSQTDELTGRELKKRILKSLKELPPMPQVAQKARQITADENASFGDLARVIETDQAIATRVLKLANSPYYGVSGTVTSVQHASVVLGMQTLSEVLTIACASGLLGTELKGYEQDSGDLWVHSLAVAGCAKNIAEKKNPALADDAFSAGLIHDCGKLVLHEYVLERIDDFRKYMEGCDKTFLSAEREILGIDHAEIAGEICGKWNIPKKIAIAIKYHHNPLELQVNELAYIVHTADAIVLMSGIGSGIDGMLYHIEEEASKFLKIDNTQLSIFMAEAVEYVNKVTDQM